MVNDTDRTHQHARQNLKKQMMQHVIEPAVLGYFRWRGDPLARLLQNKTMIDPYPLYTDLRRRGLVRSPLGSWMTARYSTVSTILRDPKFSSSPIHQTGYRPPSDSHGNVPTADLLTMDPPDHTRIRRLVSHAFTPRTITNLEPWIRTLTDQLLATVDDSRGFDLIDQLAFPLPIAVICYLLGVPVDDQARFRVWGHDIAATLEPHTDAVESQSSASERALVGYLKELVEKRRSEPDESLLSALVKVEEQGDQLTSDELVSTALLLLVAGFETTVNLIGNGTVALLQSRDQWQRLVDEPARIPSAVEELLRYDSPVQMTSRIATEDTEIEGTTIKKGASVIVVIGGANRDPDVFDQPDRVLIDRPDASRHLAFSLGIHHCLGSALARLEGRVAFEALIERYPRLRIAEAPIRRPRLVLRGFESIPLHTR